MITLDFKNYVINDWSGTNRPLSAKTVILGILESSLSNNESHLDKMKGWAKELQKNDQFQLDVVDAKLLKQFILANQSRYAFAKINLKDWIQSKIDLAEVKDNGKPKKVIQKT